MEYGGGLIANLPSGYTQLNYLESSGTQYINTNFIPNQDTAYYLKYNALSVATYCGLMGAEVTWQSSALSLWAKHIEYGSSTAVTNQDYYSAGISTLETKNGVFKYNGTVIQEFTTTEFDCTYTAYLFAINRANTFNEPCDFLRIYACKIWDGDILVRDFIPCKNETNELGMYDLVNKQFYTNAGTGTFIGG